MSHEMIEVRTFTAKQSAFVAGIVEGANITDAAIKAGYDPLHANVIGNQMLHQPQIIAAVQIGVSRQLANSAPVALKLLRDTVINERVDIRLRVVCAKTILDRAGHIAPKAVAAGQAGDVPLNEMSMTDLRQLADKLEGEIAARAKVIPAPLSTPAKAQAIEDIL